MNAASSAEQKPVAATWFRQQPHAPSVVRFTEVHVDPYAVGDIWLVCGSEMDVAVDTGSGIVPAGPVVEAVAGKPVLAVALTCSYDHAGGWHSFGRRACHRLDESSLADPTDDAADVLLYLTDDMLSAVPRPDFSPAGHRMVGAQPTRRLEDGEIIDLGDRRLEVLHTPGRSPGGLCLWESATGTLFSGEILYDGVHGPAWPPDDPAAYSNSLRRLRDLPVAVVHAGHYGSFDGERMAALIDDQLAELAPTTVGPSPEPPGARDASRPAI